MAWSAFTMLCHYDNHPFPTLCDQISTDFIGSLSRLSYIFKAVCLSAGHGFVPILETSSHVGEVHVLTSVRYFSGVGWSLWKVASVCNQKVVWTTLSVYWAFPVVTEKVKCPASPRITIKPHETLVFGFFSFFAFALHVGEARLLFGVLLTWAPQSLEIWFVTFSSCFSESPS